MSDLNALRDAATADEKSIQGMATVGCEKDGVSSSVRIVFDNAMDFDTACIHGPLRVTVATGALVPRVEAHGGVDIVRRVTAIVRAADSAFMCSGGSSRHWVRDCFLPRIDDDGLSIVDVATITADRAERDAAFVALWDAAERMRSCGPAELDGCEDDLSAAIEAARPFIEEETA